MEPMADKHQREELPSEAADQGKRFRVTRKVKSQETEQPKPSVIETREEKEMRALAEMGDEADRGTPEQDAALRSGCVSMIRVITLFFIIMFGSIVVTWFLKK